jgi:hypothetical protein
MCAAHRKTTAGSASAEPFRVLGALAPVRKAALSGLFAGVGVLGGLMADGNVTTAEVCIALGAAMTAGSVTWAVPNAD